MAQKYPVLYANYTTTELMWDINGPNICRVEGDWLVPVKMAEWYGAKKFSDDDNGITIIATSVCNWALPTIFDFARELDLLIVPCAAGVAINQHRSPNAVAMAAASYLIFGAAIGKVMDKYHWKYLVVINDLLKDIQEAGRSLSECDGLFIDLRKRDKAIQYIVIEVDSTKPGFTFSASLNQAAQHSRIIMCCTLYASMRRLLAEAYDLGMTNGDYVFMMLYESQIPFEPPIDQWYLGDENDERVHSALDNVLLFRTPKSNWDMFLNTSRAVNERREEKFGTPFQQELMYNDFIFQCHEAVEMASLAINETLTDMQISSTDELQQKISAASMIGRIVNRTHELMFENVLVTSKAIKEPIIWVQQFDYARNESVTVLHYDYKTDTYPLVDSNRPMKWRIGHVPPDRPLCGLFGEKCTKVVNVGLVVGVVTAAVMLVVAVLIGGIIWNNERKANIKRTWWIVHSTDVEHSRSTFRTATERSYFSLTTHAQNFQRKIAVVRGIRAIKTPLIWTSGKHPTVTKGYISFLNYIRKMDSHHINKLIGLDIAHRPPVLFHQWCKRGSLEDLLLLREPDWTLKLSLLHDLIHGLHYIHTTGVKMHGNLRPTKCLLDSHLSMKISDYGHETISRLLSGSTGHSNHGRPFFPPHPWMAPEVYCHGRAFPASDIYAMGTIVQQILMGYESFNTHALVGGDGLRQLKFSEELEKGALGHFLEVTKRCWLEDPAARPQMLDIHNCFSEATVYEGLRGSLIERIIRRLAKYNETLEMQVSEKTAQLQSEQQRADALLREMLPVDVVRKLRAGIKVDPEYVDEVSVLFSDIAGFTDFIAGCPPDVALHFLHNTYVYFDRAIAKVSVYKLETIGSSYVAVSGLVERIGKRHANEICRLANLLQTEFHRIIEDPRLGLLIGIHSGPVAVGVVGMKKPRYCLFGDTVNTASRMESNGLPGKIHVSPNTVPIAKTFGHKFETRGRMAIKGKGEILTYWLID
ncbi:atrial natriuretic peptide receptor 1-like [Paramacrobiotus metropolitanus]|uniref:atrial natriuretic peptide receptor 1-like n=1 Tax=Paramacrobiotus metropolitanus TaxID=2943436 RepID=UPI0024462DCD|nr:atrial natriuretic peptide receptor 1-like [Paramacrobiotus metropolitanus]